MYLYLIQKTQTCVYLDIKWMLLNMSTEDRTNESTFDGNVYVTVVQLGRREQRLYLIQATANLLVYSDYERQGKISQPSTLIYIPMWCS